MVSWRKIIYILAVLILVALWMVPMIWMFSLSFSSNEFLKVSSTKLVPQGLTLENFIGVFQVGLTLRWFWNSIVVTGLTTLLTLIFQSMTGYAAARIDFRGKRFVYPFILAGMMVPKEAMFIPLFLLFAKFQWHNSYQALFLPRIAAPLGVFIMAQFFKGIPKEIEEAVRVDGAGHWTIFSRIMLPMAYPALTALGIFTFVLTWNDYLWPLVSATRREMFTITTGLASLQGNFAQATELGSLMARGVVAALPLLILFFVFQRNLIRGISISSGGK